MADSSPFAPDTSQLPSQKDSSFQDFLEKQSRDEAARNQELRTDVKRVVGNIEKTDTELQELKPPEPYAPPKKPEVQFRSPTEAFGSAASWLAVFGSALTHAPLTAALNNSAKVINAFHEGDIETAKFNLEQWKSDSENAKTLHEFQMDKYKAALDNLKARKADAVAELQALTSAFKDQTGSLLIQNRMYGDFEKHLDALDRMYTTMQKNGPDELVMAERKKALDQLDAARKSGDPNQVQAAQQRLADINRAFPEKGGAAVTAADERTQKADRITSAFNTWSQRPENAGKTFDDFIPVWQRLNGKIDPDVLVDLKKKELDIKSQSKDAVSSAWRTYHEQNPQASWEDFVKSYQDLHGTISPTEKVALKEQEIQARKDIAAARPKSVDQQAALAFSKEHPNATAEDWAEFKKSLSAQLASKIKSRSDMFDVVSDKIDTAIGILDSDVATLAGESGLAGYVDRPLESVLTAIGAQNTAPAHLYQFELDAVKAMVPRLLAQSSRTAKDERERLDVLVSGLSPGQSAAISRQNLTELKNLLGQIKQRELGSSAYSSLADLQAAQKNGAVSYDDAVRIAKEKGWVK